MAVLQRSAFCGLKIDQSFIRAIDWDAKQEVLVRAILAMAKGLGLKTFAEGVESEEAAVRLKQLGCDQGQEYFWHRPMPPESLLEFLRSKETARCENKPA